MTDSSPRLDAASPQRVAALDALRGLTILWVTILHFAADTAGLPGADVGPGRLLAAVLDGHLLTAATDAVRGALLLPGYRLDVLLFVTGLVLGLGRARPARALLSHRARAILPGYWLGTLLVTLVLVVCAGLRTLLGAGPVLEELHAGARLARLPFEFLPWHVPLGMTVLGRFVDPSTVQVVSPSLWYIALVAQFYLAYVPMRWLMERVGTPGFLVICTTIMLALRAAVIDGMPVGTFDQTAALAAFLPFRLLSPALGMAMAPWFRANGERLQRRWSSSSNVPVGVALLLLAGWIGSTLIPPADLFVIAGPSVAVLPAVAGLWMVAAWSLARPPAGRFLTWVGQVSLGLLVMQDVLRFAVGTAQSLGAPVHEWLWPLMPVYVALALWLTHVWTPLVNRVTDSWWPRSGVPVAASPHRVSAGVVADDQPLRARSATSSLAS